MIDIDIAYSYVRLIRTLGLKYGSIATAKKLNDLVFYRKATSRICSLRLFGLQDKIHLRISSSDWSVFRDVFVNKEYEETSATHAAALRNFYTASINRGRTPVILDCGANIGLASRWYAMMFPEAIILAIEPEPSNFNLLKKNTSNFKNVISIESAISNKRSKFSLKNETDNPWAWQTVKNTQGDIDAITISDALGLIPGGIPFIAKIDIEGHEKDLFSSNIEDIDEFPLIVCEHHDWLYPWSGTAHSIYRVLSSISERDYLQNGENTFCYSHRHLNT